jgi:DNA processing protein
MRNDQLVALLACCEAAQKSKVPWWQVARVVERLGDVRPLLAGPWEPQDRWEYEVAAAVAARLELDTEERWRRALERWQRQAEFDLRFLTILDEEYPPNLRLVYNPPPFLFLRGELLRRDVRGVAVVGTRRPSPEGVRRATRLARELAHAGITVYSGLAAGIDAAAHTGALEAGGRTVAVLGHGLLRPTYPKENRPLAAAIAARGALVSQFRPDTPPTRVTFPMRNVVTSGLSQASAVGEAGQTSGARMQARVAVEQGKRVWLLRSLVESFPWARRFAAEHTEYVRVVSDVSDVVEEVRSEDEVVGQLPAGLPDVSQAEAGRRPAPEPLPLVALD